MTKYRQLERGEKYFFKTTIRHVRSIVQITESRCLFFQSASNTILDELLELTVTDDSDKPLRKIRIIDFLQFLRDHKTASEKTDKTSIPKRSNLFREVKNELTDGFVPFSTVIRYIFNHTTDLLVIQQLADDIVSTFFTWCDDAPQQQNGGKLSKQPFFICLFSQQL